MKQGTVKWYDIEKGYGFIQEDGESKKEYFVHKSGIEDLSTNLEQGQRVEFEIGEGKKGPIATNVRLVGAEA